MTARTAAYARDVVPSKGGGMVDSTGTALMDVTRTVDAATGKHKIRVPDALFRSKLHAALAATVPAPAPVGHHVDVPCIAP